MKAVIRIEGLKQILHDRESGARYAVHADDLAVPAGSFSAILGPSGCGKTTLLSVLGLLRASTPESELGRFEMWFPGDDEPTDLTEIWKKNLRAQANAIRRKRLGFALQSGELLTALTVAENIETPLRVNGFGHRECKERVSELVQAFDLVRRKGSKPADSKNLLLRSRINKLSGGEYQRVALARSIAHRPSIVFVDEPTASLNIEMARQALIQLRTLRQTGNEQSTVLMITHDTELAMEFCDFIIEMAPHKDCPVDRPSGGVVKIVKNKPKILG